MEISTNRNKWIVEWANGLQEARVADILLSSGLEGKIFKGMIHTPEDIAPDIAFP